MLFPLPFSTFDQVRDLGHSASLYCTGCHRKVPIDLNDPRLAGKTFAVRVRFTYSNVIQRWTASPPRVCGTVACLTIYPPPDRVVRPADHGIMYCGMGCPGCSPGWGIDQARKDDPLWAPLNDKRFTAYRCPTCGARLNMYWHGWETRPQGSRVAKVGT